MKIKLRIILMPLLILLLAAAVHAQTYYVKNPVNCPATYSGQSCTPIDICGLDASDIAQCYDTSTIAIPAVYNASYQSQVSSGLAAGYVLDCYSYTAPAPFCIPWLCSRNTTCYSTQFRDTNCTSTTVAPCGNCRTNYLNCTGDNTCEILDGEACTHFASLLPGTCSACGNTGNDTAGNNCTCDLSKDYFETGTLINYSSTAAMLWFKQYGQGWLINATNATNSEWGIDQAGCINFVDGTTQCTSAGAVAVWQDSNGQIQLVAGSSKLVNITDGLWVNGTTPSIYMNSSTATGNYGVALGYNTTASGDYAAVGGGYNNTASGYSTIVSGGQRNIASGSSATVSGGHGNTASNNYAAVGGGLRNIASNFYATVSGGWNNTASGVSATISGGYYNSAVSSATIGGGIGNTASAIATTVSGGGNNTISGTYSFIGGGYNNTLPGTYSFIGGGRNNSFHSVSDYSVISGGDRNYVLGDWSTIGGGLNNTVDGNYATVSGGEHNTAEIAATVGGGFGNTASGTYSTISGGYGNTADDNYAAIPGGENVTVTGRFSLAFGENILVPGNYFTVFYSNASSGYFRVNTNNASDLPLIVGAAGNTNNGGGAFLTKAGVWTGASSKTIKEDFKDVDTKEILNKVMTLDIKNYKYKGTDTSRHIGPFAEDIYDTFGVGNNQRYLASMDTAGIALIAIQELKKENNALRTELQKLKQRLEKLENER